MLSARNTSLQIGELVRELKILARDNGFILFLISHVTKVPKGEDARMDHLRDSSLISQESSIVLMVRRKEEDNQGKILIEKNTRLGFIEKAVDIVKIDGYFKEME